MVVIVLALRRHLEPAVLVAAVVVAALVFGITNTFLPAVDAYFTARNTARALEQKAANRPVYVYGVRSAWRYGLDYYLHRQLPEWAGRKYGVVVTSDAGVLELAHQGYGVNDITRPAPDVAILVLEPPAFGGSERAADAVIRSSLVRP